MLPVEAGPIADAKDEDFMTPVTVRVGDLQLNPSLKYFVVKNDCMTPRHINSGDIIGVQLLDKTFTLDDIEKGDILLIELHDEKFDGNKIRVMDYPDQEKEAFHTHYFTKEGEIQKSSKTHSFKDVRGVVREIYHKRKFAA